jgi:hypothetical protein
MSVERSPRPAAQKRPKVAAPLDAAERALRRILTSDGGPDGPSPTEEVPLVPVWGTGI